LELQLHHSNCSARSGPRLSCVRTASAVHELCRGATKTRLVDVVSVPTLSLALPVFAW
jgi:hypothetical protein